MSLFLHLKADVGAIAPRLAGFAPLLSDDAHKPQKRREKGDGVAEPRQLLQERRLGPSSRFIW